MISTHFSLCFLIKIDMLFLESFVCTDHIRYECYAEDTTCNDLPAVGDLGVL